MEDSSLVSLSFPYCHDKPESILSSVSLNIIFLWKFSESVLWRNFMMLDTNTSPFSSTVLKTHWMGPWILGSDLLLALWWFILLPLLFFAGCPQIVNCQGWFPYPPILYFISFFFPFFIDLSWIVLLYGIFPTFCHSTIILFCFSIVWILQHFFFVLRFLILSCFWLFCECTIFTNL